MWICVGVEWRLFELAFACWTTKFYCQLVEGKLQRDESSVVGLLLHIQYFKLIKM